MKVVGRRFRREILDLGPRLRTRQGTLWFTGDGLWLFDRTMAKRLHRDEDAVAVALGIDEAVYEVLIEDA